MSVCLLAKICGFPFLEMKFTPLRQARVKERGTFYCPVLCFISLPGISSISFFFSCCQSFCLHFILPLMNDCNTTTSALPKPYDGLADRSCRAETQHVFAHFWDCVAFQRWSEKQKQWNPVESNLRRSKKEAMPVDLLDPTIQRKWREFRQTEVWEELIQKC